MLAPAETAAFASTTDPISQGLVAAIIVTVFVLLTLERVHRVLVVMSAVALLWTISYTTRWHLISFEASKEAVDFNVIFLLAGMMALVGVLKSTNVFQWAAFRMLQRARGQPRAIQALTAWATGIVSALADNVTTVIFMTPMVREMAARTGVRAAAFLLPMVMASNIGGTATLIGDPPNIIIGSAAGLSFLQFVDALVIPVLWMMVALGAVSRWFYRRDLVPPSAAVEAQPEPRIRHPELLRVGLVVSALVFVGFMTHGATGMPVAVPALIGAALLLVAQDIQYTRVARPSFSERTQGLVHVIEHEIEWPTLSFFLFLFIAVGAAVATGLIDTLAVALENGITGTSARLGLDDRGTILLAALLICWVSGVLSALIDNIPFVAVAIPIVARLSTELPGAEHNLYWALALGACLGGNGTAIGASANVTVIGLAERAGVRISFREFTSFGAPIMAMTLAIASLFLTGWIYFGESATELTAMAGLLGLGIVTLIRRRRQRPAAAGA